MQPRYRDFAKDSLMIKCLGDSPKLRIIDFMLYLPLNDFTKSEIIKETGMSKRTFYRHFKELEELEVVVPTRRIAKATLYKVNREHPAVRKLEELVKELSLQIARQELEKQAVKVRVKS
ncbi:MAG: hypothetical protein DRJ98_06710 [Thermoprotei archaeon]|nr:MAG: hypothetical protein DRJ98_06710 [Thermoprotei archaeon]